MQNQEPKQLLELDFSVDLFGAALDLAVADVRQCTDFDAPAMRGFTFWSRTNRYLAEALVPLGWERTSRDNILRLMHPTRSHMITAISASGGVGDPNVRVRSKNPKGRAMARLVERNGQLAHYTIDELLYGRELDEIPTWCLLYQRNSETGRVDAELSLPIKMNGKYVDEWSERLPLSFPDLDDPGDISYLDDPGDDGGPDVMVEFLGG